MKNVANIVALGKVRDPDEGYIVAMTHLFLHRRQSHALGRNANTTGLFFQL